MKGIFMVLITFLTFSTVSFAQQLTPSELDFVFEGGDNLELAYLSDTEMQQTKGAVIQIAIPFAIGGAWQGINYVGGYYLGNYEWDTWNFIGNVATGAVIGGTFRHFGIIASGGLPFVESLTNVGANIWRVNSSILNAGVNSIWRR